MNGGRCPCRQWPVQACPRAHKSPAVSHHEAAKPESRMGQATSISAGRPRILIADDNPQGVELLEAYLSGMDCDVQTAVDGDETLRTVQSWQPDLILLDIMMPKISGFEVCKRLKSNSATRGIV